MIWVLELWHYKPEVGDPTSVMQEMDDILGPAAHDHPGWAGHAKFFQQLDGSSRAMMLYPWKSQELHVDLAETEEPKLAEYYEKYCTRPREIVYYAQLAVDVHDDDDDHDSHHAHESHDDHHTHDDHHAHSSGGQEHP